MKRIVSLVCMMIMAVSMMAPACFADGADAASTEQGFKIVKSTPENGDKGVSVENLSVKIYFDKEVMPESKAIRKANAKAFKLTDNKGKEIPIKVYYSHKEQKDGLLMVVSDVIDSDIKIQGATKYTLTISEDLQATDGTKLGVAQKISFKTLDQAKSTTGYTILMVLMMVGMVVFSTRSAKKAATKEAEENKKPEVVNPYKEAKRTGKSVAQVVAEDQKRKAKEAEELAKKKAKEAALLDDEDEEEVEEPASGNLRVARRRPISEAGSEYKVKVVKTQPEKKATSTNPKNQSGKQKNKKKGGKK